MGADTASPGYLRQGLGRRLASLSGAPRRTPNTCVGIPHTGADAATVRRVLRAWCATHRCVTPVVVSHCVASTALMPSSFRTRCALIRVRGCPLLIGRACRIGDTAARSRQLRVGCGLVLSVMRRVTGARTSAAAHAQKLFTQPQLCGSAVRLPLLAAHLTGVAVSEGAAVVLTLRRRVRAASESAFMS